MNEKKNKLLKSYGFRICVYCITATLLFSVATVFQTSAGSTDFEYYIVHGVADVKKLKSAGIQIIDTYDTALLIKASDYQKKLLENTDYEVEPIFERTIIEAGKYRFDTKYSLPDIPAELKVDKSNHYIIQFVGPIKESWKNAVRECGAQLYDKDYVYHFGFYARMDDNTKSKVLNLPFVEWVGINQPAYKIRFSNVQNGEIALSIFVYEAKYLDTLRQKLIDIGIEVEQVVHSVNAIYATVPSQKIPAVAKLEEVEWLYERPSLKLFCDRVGVIDGAHDVWYPETNGLGMNITGLGQIVGIFDTGFARGYADDDHYDFFRGPIGDRVLIADGADYELHGTHVAGIILANGWCWAKSLYPGLGPSDAFDYRETNAGIAPEATLVSYSPIAQAITEWAYAYAQGARILSNSWGPQTVINGYVPEVDRFYHGGHQDCMVVFAAGNDGPANYTVSGYGNNWNGMSAGARENNRPEKGADCDDPSQVVDFSGRGPSAFVPGSVEVVKPDLLTVGSSVLSARSPAKPYDPDIDPYTNCKHDNYPDGPDGIPDHVLMSGTSMACPRLAGGAALVRQYYMDYEGITSPWVELIKATLINGAEDIGYGYTTSSAGFAVNKDQGWGGLNVKNSICPDAPATNSYATHEFTASYEEWYPSIPLTIESDKVPLKITLVWSNPTGERPGNKLDLIVTSPAGIEYRGNQFENSVSKPEPTMFDDANNVEQVIIPSPETGTWNVVVKCTEYSTWARAAVVMSADIGPVATHKINLKALSTPHFLVAPGGTSALQLKLLNYGTSTEDIQLTDNAPSGITVNYQPASAFTLASGEEVYVTVIFTASTTMPDGSFNFKISAETLPSPPDSQDSVDITIDICSAKLPKVVQVTTDSWSQTEPYVLAFNYMGIDYVFVAYITETTYGTRIEVTKSIDGGETFAPPIRIRNPSSANLADTPHSVGLCWLESGTYEGRVILWWGGTNPDTPDPELSFWFCIAYSEPPYDTWIPVEVDTNSGITTGYSNYKRTMFVVPRPAYDQLIAVNEILASAPGADQPSEIYIISFVSNDGGTSWSSMIALPQVDSAAQPHFFPYGFLDVDGDVWVHYYVSYTTYRVSRTVRWAGTPGDWETPKKVTENVMMNYMFPAGVSTPEGPNSNRIYYAYTNSTTHAEVKQLRMRYSDDAAAGGNTWNPPWDDATYPDGYGPIGNGLVSQAGYTTKHVLDVDKTPNGYVWITYMEEPHTSENPFHMLNLHVAYSNDGFQTSNYYRLTADGFTKSQKCTSTIGNTLYTVYASNSYTGNMDIWLRIYSLNFETAPDTVGPDVVDVTASPNPTYGAPEINITANAIEFNTGNSNIAAAEYFVDTVGTPGTGTAMSAIDGAFDSPSEAVSATISTAGWNPGEVHTIYVRARDSANNWGDVSSVAVSTEPVKIEVTVISPAGGERWTQGDTYQIKWNIVNGTAPFSVKLRYSTDAGVTYNLITELYNIPAGISYYDWTIPMTVPASANCKIKVTVLDANNKAGSGVSNTFSIGAPDKIYLTAGWNFISIPTLQPDESIEVVLQDIANKYDIVQYYDASSPDDHWKVYEVNKPQYLNDMRTIDNKMGFWIHMTQDAVYNITGDWPTTETVIPLYKGWNMVGYPSQTAQTVQNAFSQLPAGYVVQCYDATANYKLRTMLDTEYLQCGKAYWVYVPSDCTWTVPP